MDSGTSLSSQERALLSAVEEVGRSLDTLRDLLSRLEAELQSYRERHPAPVLSMVNCRDRSGDAPAVDDTETSGDASDSH